MGWEWMPSTPEEIAEHQRMRRELIECRQMYDNKNKIINFQAERAKRKKKSKSVLVTLAVVTLGVYLFCNGGFTIPQTKDAPAASAPTSAVGLRNADTEETGFDTSVHYGKYVSKNASRYIQQVNAVNFAYERFCFVLNDDLCDNGDASYGEYSEDIDALLNEINSLRKMNIYRYDSLNSYQAVCEEYFSVLYSFFYSSKQRHVFSITEYNQMVAELNLLDNPFQHLLTLFEEKKFYYYLKEDGKVYYMTQY